MSTEKGTALVLRGTDWSESSRIVTLYTREHGKVRAVAKGGRRSKSTFENALDLLTLCSIVFIRKSPDVLDILTEARVERRFSELTRDLTALYSAYYLAELLSEWTEENDPHPELFDLALTTLERLGKDRTETAGLIFHYELRLMLELGHGPTLENCAHCGLRRTHDQVSEAVLFSVEQGGLICRKCKVDCLDRRWITRSAFLRMCELQQNDSLIDLKIDPALSMEMRRVLSHYVSHWLGRRPRMLHYLEQGS